MALPPVFAASALYDSLLQSALRQFFGRATFETEPIPSLSSDGRLAIEPTNDPSVLSIRWFGSRHVLHVPARRPFTPHEVRLAKAIGSVLALRYRAIFDPKQMLERGDLFRGAIEDRYISAFLNAQEQSDAAHARADLVATALEILRVAALSSYENKAISSGVLLVDDEDGRHSMAAASLAGLSYKYSPALTGIKSFYRLSDGIETLFLVNRDGTVLDIIESGAVCDLGEPRRSGDPRRARVRPPTARTPRHRRTTATSASCSAHRTRSRCLRRASRCSASATPAGTSSTCRRSTRCGSARSRTPALASRLFQTALDLADARQGALFVVLRDAAASLPLLVAPGDRLDAPRGKPGDAPDRVQLLHMLRGRSAVNLDPAVLAGLAKTDGATVMDGTGTAARRRRDSDAHRTARTALDARRRRRPHHGRDGRRPLRRGPQGQRGRPHHVLRSAGEDLGHLKKC